jgi:hypothetical protein
VALPPAVRATRTPPAISDSQPHGQNATDLGYWDRLGCAAVWDPQGQVYDGYGMVDPASIYPVQSMGLNEQQLLVYGYVGEGSGLQLLQFRSLP